MIEGKASLPEELAPVTGGDGEFSVKLIVEDNEEESEDESVTAVVSTAKSNDNDDNINNNVFEVLPATPDNEDDEARVKRVSIDSMPPNIDELQQPFSPHSPADPNQQNSDDEDNAPTGGGNIINDDEDDDEDEIVPERVESTKSVATNSSSSKSRKRKELATSDNTVSLLAFVQKFIELTKQIKIVDGEIKLPIIDTTFIEQFKRDGGSNKKRKIPTSKDATETTKRTISPHEYITVFILLSKTLEKHQCALAFSREYLKFFFITHKRFVSIRDFANVSSTTVHSNQQNTKRGKSVTKLTNGSILVEYAKAPEQFGNNLRRCDLDDIIALRLIIENNIEFSNSTYNLTKYPKIQYETTDSNKLRGGYVKIAINNWKHAVLIVNSSSILMYDCESHQYSLPPMCVEKDISTKIMLLLQKYQCKNYIFDVLLSPSKCKIIDVQLEWNANVPEKSRLKLPSNYIERLRKIPTILPDIKVVQLSNNCYDGSCIQKPIDEPTQTSYIYHKPMHAVGVIGLLGKQAMIVYRGDEEDEFIYKTRASVTGLALYMGAGGVNKFASLQDPKIKWCGKQYRIKNLPTPTSNEEIRLFNNLICVKLRDGVKLGEVVDTRDAKPTVIAHASDYKSPNMHKEGASDAVQALFDMMKRVGKDKVEEALKRFQRPERMVSDFVEVDKKISYAF